MLTSLQTGSNRAEACLARLQNLNPMVEVSFEAGDVADKPDEFFRDFDVAVVVSCDRALLCRVDAACRAAGVKFYSGDVVGYFGWAFADLGRHNFTEEVPKKIPKEHCQQVPKKKCHDVPIKVPIKVPKQKCHDVPIKVPIKVPKKKCHDVPKKKCHKHPVKVPKKARKGLMITFYASKIITVPVLFCTVENG